MRTAARFAAVSLLLAACSVGTVTGSRHLIRSV